MTNLLSVIEQKALADARAVVSKLSADAKAVLAKELSWVGGHAWECMVFTAVIGMAFGHWVL